MMPRVYEGCVNTGLRFLRGLSRPSKASNTRLLRVRRVSIVSRNPRCYIFRYTRPRAPARNDLERNAQLAAKGADLRTSRASMAGYVRPGRRQLVLLGGRTPERRIGGICQRCTVRWRSFGFRRRIKQDLSLVRVSAARSRPSARGIHRPSFS